MASSPPENEAEKAPEQPKNITFRFCRECSNMLYPRENPGENTLDFACRTCNFSEPASTSCVFRNELRNTVGETAGITQDVAQDPTVGLSSYSNSNSTSSNSNNNIPDFCTLCGQEIFCEICGQETDRGFWLEVEDDDVSGMRTPTVGRGEGGSGNSQSMFELAASQRLMQLQLDAAEKNNQQKQDSQKQEKDQSLSSASSSQHAQSQ